MQKNAERIEAANLQLVAISYDSVEVLDAFAKKSQVAFPLLSDPDSKVIEQFGLLNDTAAEGTRKHRIAYPMTVLVDKAGVVIAKLSATTVKRHDSDQLLKTLADVTSKSDTPTVDELIKLAAKRLVELQAQDGAWPYEGVYRVRRRIPFGYRIGGTAIVSTALMYASDDDDATKAIERGVDIMLKDLEHPLMKADTANTYDVRVWGHIYALELFCRFRTSDRFAELRKRTDPWIPKLVQILRTEQIADGGWNYAGQQRHASFVTSPAVQALLLAKQQGEDVPDEVFLKARKVLLASRSRNGAFRYSGVASRRGSTALPGAIARSAVCESTLILLGQGNVDHVRDSIAAFHMHWDELEKRRKKNGTHEGPYRIAPYYFYYGHRYIGQAIQFLPKEEQAAELEKFKTVLLRTKDPDNTWNDRVFARSKAYGTAMSILALLNNVKVPEVLKSE